MEWLDRYVSPAQVALEQAPEILQSVRVDLPVHVSLGMVDKLMHKTIVQQVVSNGVVGIDLRAVPHVLQDFVLQSLTLHVGNDLAANLPQIAVKDTLHSSLAEVQISELILAANVPQFQFAALVHVDSLSTNKGFVSFNCSARTTEFEHRFVFHGFTNPVQHEPCRLLTDAESLPQLVAADSVLAVADHPKRSHPLVKADGRIFHHRVDLDRELLFALITKPDAPSLDKRVLGLAATWTGDIATGPAQPYRILESTVRIREVNNRFLECFWVFHDSNSTLNSHVCQAFSCHYKFLPRKFLTAKGLQVTPVFA